MVTLPTVEASSQCAGAAGHRCYLQLPTGTFYEYHGRKYCQGHLPADHPKKNGPLMQDLLAAAVTQGQRDFCGCIFPGGTNTKIAGYRLQETALILKDCQFGEFLELNVGVRRPIGFNVPGGQPWFASHRAM